MSGARPQAGSAPSAEWRAHDSGHEPVGELVQKASQQLNELVRAELRLAQAEMAAKGKQYGVGGGLFGGAGVVGFLTLQALVVTVIAVLAVPLPVWAAALIVTAALGAVAAVMAVAGKKGFQRAAPPAPEHAIENLRADVARIKGSTQR